MDEMDARAAQIKQATRRIVDRLQQRGNRPDSWLEDALTLELGIFYDIAFLEGWAAALKRIIADLQKDITLKKD